MEPTVNPDDVCGVCETPRDQHGDKNHVFTLTDQLMPLSPAPKPRQDPPRERGGVLRPEPPVDPTALGLATLVEILAEKQILDAPDIIRIFTRFQ